MTYARCSRHRFNNTGSNHITIARHTARGPTRLCKFTKWHHERRKSPWETENIARKPAKPMLNTPGDAIPVHAANPHKRHSQPANPHKPG